MEVVSLLLGTNGRPPSYDGVCRYQILLPIDIKKGEQSLPHTKVQVTKLTLQ